MPKIVNIGAAIRQVNVSKIVKLATVMRTAEFRQGFEDARAGRPHAEHRITRHAWSYERGRLFFFVWGVAPFKDGQRIIPAAVAAMDQAVRQRAIL